MNGENLSTRTRAYWLGGYGLYAFLLGATSYLLAGRAVLGGPPLSESNFVGHLTQSHASTVIGLGVIALGVRKVSGSLRTVSAAIFLASLLGALIYWLSTPADQRGGFSLFMVLSQLFWAAGFAWVQRSDSPDVAAADVPWRGWGRAVLISFCVLVIFSGLIWVLAPLKFATAAAGPLAGPAAEFAGQTRGAADIAIGIAAWAALRGGESGKPILVGVLIANVLLVIAGGLAQASALYNPARWVVEGLHVAWSLCFLVMLARRSWT